MAKKEINGAQNVEYDIEELEVWEEFISPEALFQVRVDLARNKYRSKTEAAKGIKDIIEAGNRELGIKISPREAGDIFDGKSVEAMLERAEDRKRDYLVGGAYGRK